MFFNHNIFYAVYANTCHLLQRFVYAVPYAHVVSVFYAEKYPFIRNVSFQTDLSSDMTSPGGICHPVSDSPFTEHI